MKIVDMVKGKLKKIEQHMHYNLLHVDAAEHSYFRRGYRLVYYALRGVNVHRTMVDSAALTLYTLLALVPMLTLVLLILGRVGVVEKTVPLIYSSLPEKWSVIFDNLLAVAHGAAENIAPGFLAIVGIAMLIFMVFALFSTVEKSFNRVFDVSVKRGFLYRYIAYILIALFVPTLLLTAFTVAYDVLAALGFGDGINNFLGSLISIILVTIATMLMYKSLPYTNVAWRNALYAGVFAGVTLSLWMKGYVYFQQLMTSFNVVYGSLAAVPLFIIWLQVSWNIVLVGCELCAVWQYRHRYESIDRWRIKVAPKNGNAVKVVIVGSGNVAEAFARTLSGVDGIELVQVFARNCERGMAVAKVGGCEWVADPEELAEADIYIISVSDRSVKSVAESLNVSERATIVHTAGSVPMSVIPKRKGGRGIIYPLQSFTSGREVNLADVPLFVEADSEEVSERLMNVASLISSRVEYADSERRRTIHLAGVFVNNFVNHLYAMGGDILDCENLDFDMLKPLIAETASKALATNDPRVVQTGPAVRGDMEVTERHMAMLEDDECKQQIYKLITQSIWETSKKI